MTPLKIVIFQQAEWWVAQCLEHNIAGQGKTLREAIYQFQTAFASELAICKEIGGKLEDIQAAPAIYWKMFEGAERIEVKETIPFRTSSFVPEKILKEDVRLCSTLP
ncbi:MAG: hypothetical protein LLH30_15730 [Candidatus Manganitrophus sp. SA1]|nr:hypothetical protein [Candidatus Manganitrophus morganii]